MGAVRIGRGRRGERKSGGDGELPARPARRRRPRPKQKNSPAYALSSRAMYRSSPLAWCARKGSVAPRRPRNNPTARRRAMGAEEEAPAAWGVGGGGRGLPPTRTVFFVADRDEADDETGRWTSGRGPEARDICDARPRARPPAPRERAGGSMLPSLLALGAPRFECARARAWTEKGGDKKTGWGSCVRRVRLREIRRVCQSSC